jgi:hypothetical protein
MKSSYFLEKSKEVKEYLENNKPKTIPYSGLWVLYGIVGRTPDRYEKTIMTKCMARMGYNVKHPGNRSRAAKRSYYYNIETYQREAPRKPCDMSDEEIISLVDRCFAKYDTYTINLVIYEGGFPEVFVRDSRNAEMVGRSRIRYLISHRSKQIGAYKVSHSAYAGASYIRRMNVQ